MPTISIPNQTIYYAARGQHGAPLVFIHGAGDNHLLWNDALAAAANASRVYALDLPGHGRSSGSGCATILEYANVVREFLDAVEIECAVFVGISMGGAIAQTLALEFPTRVLGLGLVGTGARLRVAPQFLDGIQNDFENTARALAANFYSSQAADALIETSAATLMAMGAQILYADFAACDAFDARARLGEIRAPTLVVCGAADKMTPPRYSEFLAQHIAGAELQLIDNAGHLALREQPTEFKRILLRWLEQFRVEN